MKEEEFCATIRELEKEYTQVLRPTMQALMEKEKKDLTAADFVLLAEATHKLWIISEVLKGRTAFLLEEDDKSAGDDATGLTTREMVDLYGRKVMEAKNKIKNIN